MKSFCISLKKKKHLWDDLSLYFAENGVPNITFSQAVNGYEIGEYYNNPNSFNVSPETLALIQAFGGVNKIVSTWGLYHLINKKSRKEHAQLTTWGAVGCTLSHFLLWKQMLDEKLDSILIFEDDINFFHSFKDVLPQLLQNIPEDADVVFLDILRNFKGVRYNDYFDRVLDQFFGTHAYIITNKGASKLVPYVLPIEIQIDSYMGFRANINNLSFYTARDICGQKPHISTIQTIAPCTICEFNEKQIYYLNSTFTFLILFTSILVLVLLYYIWKKN